MVSNRSGAPTSNCWGRKLGATLPSISKEWEIGESQEKKKRRGNSIEVHIWIWSFSLQSRLGLIFLVLDSPSLQRSANL